MSVSVKIFGNKQHEVQEVEASGTVLNVLGELGLSPQEYIASLDGEVVPVDEPVKDGDAVVLVRIVSGG